MVIGIGANLTNSEKRAHLTDIRREHLIEAAIRRFTSMTRSDLDRKLVVYESDDKSEEVSERLLRDFRRLVKQAPLAVTA
jgi:hypothetical protein